MKLSFVAATSTILLTPKAYTKPFTVSVVHQIVPDGSELIEFICHENQMFLKLTGRERR
jgi:hypothetical protein